MNPTIECGVVMLRHKDGTIVSRQSDNQMPAEQNTDWQHRESNYLWKNHLYFTSNEEIKEGDWWFNLSLHRSFPGTDSCRPYNDWDKFSAEHLNSDRTVWVKIVASTDPTLGLPLIPDTWVKKTYIPSSGEYLITKVIIEGDWANVKRLNPPAGIDPRFLSVMDLPPIASADIIPNTINNEVIILEQYPEKPRPITVSFSPYCIGEDRDQYKRKKCMCSRCLTRRGEVPDEYTELIAHIHSCFNKYELHEGTSKIIAKDREQKLKYAKSDLKDLIMHLQWILEPPTI